MYAPAPWALEMVRSVVAASPGSTLEWLHPIIRGPYSQSSPPRHLKPSQRVAKAALGVPVADNNPQRKSKAVLTSLHLLLIK